VKKQKVFLLINIPSMKSLSVLAMLCLAGCLTLSGCSKDDDDSNQGETKTQTLTKSTWLFQKAEAAIAGDVSSEIKACIKDNTLTFVSTATDAGTGTVDEGATSCNAGDPQSSSFTWTLESNGTVLKSSMPLFPGGSGTFNVVSLNATNLVLSQEMTIAPYPTTTITLTLKH
jgi:hypothetical protein